MNIYIGNLNYQVSETQIFDLVEAFGEVKSAKLIIDRETGRSRGFAFVEMETQEAAELAIKELSGKEFEGRSLVVREAKPRN